MIQYSKAALFIYLILYSFRHELLPNTNRSRTPPVLWESTFDQDQPIMYDVVGLTNRIVKYTGNNGSPHVIICYSLSLSSPASHDLLSNVQSDAVIKVNHMYYIIPNSAIS